MPVVSVCVSCGKKEIGDNHKCSKRHEAARIAAQTAANNRELRLAYTAKDLTFNQRIMVGFSMIGE